MQNLARLINAAAARCEPPTIVELKARLGVSRQTIYDWKNGAIAINDEHLARLIELAQASPMEAITIRKETAKSPAERNLWTRLLRVAMPIMSSVRAWMRRVATPLARLLPATRRSPVPLSIPLGA